MIGTIICPPIVGSFLYQDKPISIFDGHHHTCVYAVYIVKKSSIHITTNHHVYNICIHSTTKFKVIPLLCTHIESYVFSTVHSHRVVRI